MLSEVKTMHNHLMWNPDPRLYLRISDRQRSTQRNAVNAKSGMVGSTKNIHALMIAIINTVNISLSLELFYMVKLDNWAR